MSSSVTGQISTEEREKFEQEREKLVVQRVKLPNGATFTKLKPVGATR